ncbi:Nif3-like dinuclear metal center hexameric protein [candidate division WOR-3 bacterium]|nr:Nif3-like dinuclear metal center hexameric protein [candidate division WOR-3 bacterium]
MKSRELAEKINQLLQVDKINDILVNGLLVDNKGDIEKIALSVDASLEAFIETKKRGANLLLVHHGLFKKEVASHISGVLYERIKFLLDNNIGLYSCHLPLDVHHELGNNAQAVKLFGGKEGIGFGIEGGISLGKEIILEQSIHIEELIDKINSEFKTQIISWRFGQDRIRTIGYISGGGIGYLREAIDLGFDVFVTGEPRHSAYWVAKEAKMNCIFAGHYATETLGIKALGSYINTKFGIDIEFIDLPTGH